MKKVRYSLGAIAAAPAVLSMAAPVAGAAAPTPQHPATAAPHKSVRPDGRHHGCAGTTPGSLFGGQSGQFLGSFTFWWTQVATSEICVGTIKAGPFGSTSFPVLPFGSGASVRTRVSAGHDGTFVPVYHHRSLAHDNATGAPATARFYDHVRRVFHASAVKVCVSLWASVGLGAGSRPDPIGCVTVPAQPAPAPAAAR